MMTNVVETARIAERPDVLWRDVGLFGAIGQWHPLLSKVESEGEHPGALRAAEAKDGSRQIERLLEATPAKHLYRYRMEKTAMPVRDYSAEFRIEDNHDGTSTVVWLAEFEPTSQSARSRKPSELS
ncbi:SRPBCC family protein [Bradyrhizobium sp. USDA 4486]